MVTPAVLQTGLRLFAHPFLTLGCKMRVGGYEHVRTASAHKKPIIFAANHVSEFDPIVVTNALPWRTMFYVALSRYDGSGVSWRGRFYGGRMFRALGAYPILQGTHDYAKSLAYHLAILRAGKSMLIFPEGRIRRGRKDLPAHGGVTYLAEATDALVVPVCINGAENISLKNVLRRRVRVDVAFAQPITAAELFAGVAENDPDRYKKAASVIMRRVDSLVRVPSADTESTSVPETVRV
ncbi:MAG TPA: lysophospholipid acyltransferase family protein [Candidatus Paceibacterota bacterium]